MDIKKKSGQAKNKKITSKQDKQKDQVYKIQLLPEATAPNNSTWTFKKIIIVSYLLSHEYS